jgi:hypothetical protein
MVAITGFWTETLLQFAISSVSKQNIEGFSRLDAKSLVHQVTPVRSITSHSGNEIETTLNTTCKEIATNRMKATRKIVAERHRGGFSKKVRPRKNRGVNLKMEAAKIRIMNHI